MEHTDTKGIAILGSTGSIGTQALQVMAAHPDHFRVEVLTANRNATLLIQQALRFKPNAVVIADPAAYAEVKAALEPAFIKVFAGEESIAQVVAMESIDLVLTAQVGYSGLLPTLEAIRNRKTIALANKETLVVAGDLVTRLAQEMAVNIYPVDSEHSAIFQCLAGEWQNPVEKLILTASGGPFRGKKRKDLEKVTRQDALKHPNWDMGHKITIDSATLMNKGLEVIEARWLFNVPASRIEVVVHPQSIIHSMVQFEDGSIKAQLGLPDMMLPIQYALAYPNRLPSHFPRFQISNYPSLTFEAPDLESFPCLALAYEALSRGGNMPCILNAANEVAVQCFLEEKIKFLQIPDLIEKTMNGVQWLNNPSYEDYVHSNQEARRMAGHLAAGQGA